MFLRRLCLVFARGFLFLVFAVFVDSLVEELLTEFLNLLLAFVINLGGIFDSSSFEVGIDQLFGGLVKSVKLIL